MMDDAISSGNAEEEHALEQKIRRLQGPILVLGGSGFVGGALMRLLLRFREDVFGTTARLPAWRLEGLPPTHILTGDLLIDSHIDLVLDVAKPRTIFDCIAYGAYSFETSAALIYQTNFQLATRLLERLDASRIACYVHAGSSSEYGDNAAGPAEDSLPAPNSAYAVSKVAAANLLLYHGKRKKLPCVNLRLYSVYGPLEDASRLIPNVIRHGTLGRYPEFVSPDISRDFVFVDDVCEAFIDAALNLREEDFGESFNIGTGARTTIADVASVSRDLFKIEAPPQFTMPSRQWDIAVWYANIEKAKARLGWAPRTSLRAGLLKTIAWYEELPDKERYQRSSKIFGLDVKHSVSAVVACVSDEDKIEDVYSRLKTVFGKLNIDHEIIFVIDGVDPAKEEAVRALSQNDARVLGVCHSRGFGAQAALRSGMEVATKNSCILMNANLEDPPELIEPFLARWREGFDVVHGRRVGAGVPLRRSLPRRAFYRLFNLFSYVSIPHDATEFGLMDRQVVQAMLRFPERGLFLQGIRAFAGFRQSGVSYEQDLQVQARRKEGLAQRIRRAKHGMLSFSNAPLTLLSLVGSGLLVLSLLMGLAQVAIRLLYPERSVSGITTVLLVILFFGSINVFAVGLIGEYVGRIFEEVKRRPHFIRRTFLKDGEIRRAAQSHLSRED